VYVVCGCVVCVCVVCASVCVWVYVCVCVCVCGVWVCGVCVCVICQPEEKTQIKNQDFWHVAPCRLVHSSPTVCQLTRHDMPRDLNIQHHYW